MGDDLWQTPLSEVALRWNRRCVNESSCSDAWFAWADTQHIMSPADDSVNKGVLVPLYGPERVHISKRWRGGCLSDPTLSGEAVQRRRDRGGH